MDIHASHNKWCISHSDNTLCQDLTKNLRISLPLSKVLVNRSINSIEKAARFLKPDLASLPPASVIPDMQKGAEFIYKAIKAHKRILVFGDYDVDGVTGTVLLVRALSEINARIDYYVPHRTNEGYGLNKNVIRTLAESGTEIIITVDCGISNKEEIELAKELGMEVVVLDHHTPPSQLPPAYATIDPKLQKPGAPYYYVAGVGVAYLFIEEVLRYAGLSSDILKKHLDLVALGTIADVVPLVEENRILTYFGLKQLNSSGKQGIQYLKDITSLTKDITEHSVGYVLGPRINAAGRIEHASISIDLLLSDDKKRSNYLSQKLSSINEYRKQIGEDIRKEILNSIDIDSVKDLKNLIIAGKNWHPGVIGIVASQIAQRFNRPTVIISVSNGIGKGSVRSTANIDIFTPLQECSHLFTKFGGHREAAGFEIEESRIPEFKELYTRCIESNITLEDLMHTITVDTQLQPSEITLELAKELTRLAPFGNGNDEPVFYTSRLIPIDYKLIGNGDHIRITFTDGNSMIPAVGFNMANYLPLLRKQAVDVVYHLKVNSWNGKTNFQLNLLDLKESFE